MSALLLALTLLQAPQPAQGGFFSLDPDWLPPTTAHWHTQVGHGLITGVGAAVGAIIDGESGAKWGAAIVVAYYAIREALAHRSYARADLTDEERAKARWDSKMDVAYPVVVAAVPWTWGHRRDAWPWWLASLAATVMIGRATDPGGQVFGMR